MLHTPPANYHLAAKQRPRQKAYILTKYTEEFSRKKKSGEWASRHKKKEKTERAMRVGRRVKKGDNKMESNDSPEIPDREDTSDIPGLHSGNVPVNIVPRILRSSQGILLRQFRLFPWLP